MRHTIFIFFILLSQLAQSAINDSITVSGKSMSYANMNLTIKKQSNYITKEKQALRSFLVDKNGNFKTTIPINSITKIYINLGVTEGYLFVEPGKKYELELPPYIPLKQEDKLNPFFIPQSVLLGIKNNSSLQLNKNIREFEISYNEKFTRNIKRIVLTNNHQLARKIIEETNQEFPAEQGSYFFNYKEYTYLNLLNFLKSNKKRKVINDFFSLKPIEYNLDPYWDSFNHLFTNFFHYYITSKQGKEIKENWIHNAPFDSLVISLNQDTLFKNRNFAELVLLKGLYDAYYSDNYDKEKVINNVYQATKECKNDFNKKVAIDILNKISKLRVGTKAPSLSLPTLTGKIKDLTDYKGKFIYLNFANTKNFACKKDFQVLDQFADMFKKDMVIITVLTDEDPDEAYQYIKNNKFKWVFLHYNQNAKCLMDYNIKGFPTYYLIDPEGNLVFSPAPAPEENFAPVFSEKYNEYRYKKLRKEKPKKRTIYDL